MLQHVACQPAVRNAMKPLPFVWPYALVFWLVLVWAFLPEFGIVRRAQREQTASDARSLQVITQGGGFVFLLAFFLAWWPALRMGPGAATVAFYAGLAIIVAGSLLRRHCWRMLGSSFTGDVRARADQQIVTAGAYRWLRHPSYTAGILLNLGVGLALGSWISAALLLAGSFGVYWYRMNVEERALLATIGEPYRQFMRERKRIVPFVY